MNLVILSGRLTRDPEMRRSNSGTAIVKVGIAVDKYSKEEGKGVEFFNVTIFGNRAESVAQYLRQGDGLTIQGVLRTSKYDKNGTTVYSTDIIANQVEFGARKGGSGSSESAGAARSDRSIDDMAFSATDEDIPF